MPEADTDTRTIRVKFDWPEEGISSGHLTLKEGRVRVGQIIALRYKGRHSYACKLLERTKTGILVLNERYEEIRFKLSEIEIEGRIIVKKVASRGSRFNQLAESFNMKFSIVGGRLVMTA
jgi:hypothetical protein